MINIQAPAEVQRLLQLICKLNRYCGPMKCATVKDGKISIGFISAKGLTDVKRLTARVSDGPVITGGSRRRVYEDLKILDFKNKVWETITDQDYIAAGLYTPTEYAGRNKG